MVGNNEEVIQRMSFFRRSLFVFAHSLNQPDFYPVYQRLMKNPWRPLAELRTEQNKQLRYIIQYCNDHVPFYHALFKNLGIRPDSIKTVNDLRKLPVLTKEKIKENWDSLKPVNLERLRYREESTGGTTGTPFKYRYSSNDRFLSGALLYRGWGYAGYKLSDRMVFLAGSSLVTGTKHGLEKKVHEHTRNIRKLSSFDMGDQEMRSYARLIAGWNPLFIRGYPSSIHHFCEWLEEEKISLPVPKAVFTTSEKIFPLMREKISSYFNAPVFDGYGLNDGGVTAFECGEHQGLHIDTERSVMELIDNTGDVIESGEGTILATSFHNFAMPFLRYDTGDIATLAAEPCTCGRAHPLLREIVGRTTDILITPEGNRVHGWFFLYVLDHLEGIKEFQVVQKTAEEIQFNLVIEENFDDAQLGNINQMIVSKSPRWKIEFHFVDKIDRTASGKFKYIINNIK